MPRFFVTDGGLTPEVGSVTLTGEDARHIALSLRMAVGEEITLSDGAGLEFACRLRTVTPGEVVAEVLSSAPSVAEPPFPVHLFVAYPKGDKLDFVIEKAVELGAASITPFFSERCVRRPAAEKTARLAERYNRIARAAAGQCGRGVLPLVCPPLDFTGMLATARRCELALFCYEGGGTRPIGAVLSPPHTPASCAVIVGAEGGFAPAEATAAEAAGCVPTGLGPRILRCETAPLVALSALLYRYELGL